MKHRIVPLALLIISSLSFAACSSGPALITPIPPEITAVPGAHEGGASGTETIPAATPSAPGDTASTLPTLVPSQGGPPPNGSLPTLPAPANPPPTLSSPNGNYLPSPTPVPPVAVLPSPAPPTPIPPSQQGGAGQPAGTGGEIRFLPGTDIYTVVTDLASNAPQTYTFGATAGQELYVQANGNFGWQVLNPNGRALTGRIVQSGPWGLALNQSGTFSIVVSGVGHAVLTVYIPPIGQNNAVPSPISEQRVSFQPGTTGATLTVNLSEGALQGLVLYAGPRRQLFVTTSGDVTVTLVDPNGKVVPPAYSPGHWKFALGPAGDYTVLLAGIGPVTVTTEIPTAP